MSSSQHSERSAEAGVRELLASSAPGWTGLWAAWVAIWAAGVVIAGNAQGDVTDLVVGLPLAWGLARANKAGAATPLLLTGAVAIFAIALLAGLLNS